MPRGFLLCPAIGVVVSLAERLKERPEYKPKFEAWLDQLSKDDRAALLAAAVDPAWTTTALHRIIRDEGGSVNEGNLGEWRKRNGLIR